ncbi:YceI family protein [Leptospira langatensis]|uniref:YceI family protein n=1 Tax=Leptospira langatensis TaxID=2484983 RepID=A0A5F1ZU61_9LEPT|nr:YceI family protein [Leptospira langatensis]TGJ98923.1 YceI family protein [Leptospira langatensis]TGL40509.1 YceI family protein [Leptospira langatensis]
MKFRINSSYFRILSLGLFLASILSGAWQSKTFAADTSCKYSVAAEQTSLEWKAFKFTEKTGVGGKFTKVSISGTKPGDSVTQALKGLKFSIDPADLNSGNTERDPKIKGAFFGNLKSGGKISGSLSSISLEADQKSGKGVVHLTLNGVTKPVPLQFTLENGNILNAKGSVDLNHWNAGAALKALNDLCKELHTSKDGKSVLWPDVEIAIKSELKKDCK